MTTTAEALEVMAVVAACHHRTAPRLDDRQAALVTATIWAELFTTYNLELPDLIAAVKKRASTHPEAPEPADIIRHAREIRRDRSERETDTQRRAREDARDAELDRKTLAAIAQKTGTNINRIGE